MPAYSCLTLTFPLCLFCRLRRVNGVRCRPSRRRSPRRRRLLRPEAGHSAAGGREKGLDGMWGRAGGGVGAGAIPLIVVYNYGKLSKRSLFVAAGVAHVCCAPARKCRYAPTHTRTHGACVIQCDGQAQLRPDALAESALTVISPCHWVWETFVVSIRRMPSLPTFEGPRAQCLQPSHPDMMTQQWCRAL